MRRITKGMKKSRLSKYVLYRHDGYAKDVGFTCNFKLIEIKLKRFSELGLIQKGWYLVEKAPTNPSIIVSISDLKPLHLGDLLNFGRRMRMRFFKLLNGVGEKGGRVDKNMRVYPVRRMPLLVGYETALLMLGPGGVVEYEKLPYTTIFAKVREKAEYVLLSETKKGKRALIITAI